MAESFVFDIARSVLGKLGSLSLEEFFLVWGLQGEVEEIKKTMVAINAVLLDAEQRQSQNHTIEVWLGELKDVLYDIEDIADEFECEAQRRQVVKSGRKTRKVSRYFSTSNPLVFHIRMAHILKNIRDRLDRVEGRKSRLGLSDRVNDMPVNFIHRERAMTHSFVRKEDVIGREEDKENIINMLLQPVDGENVSIIPIVGIGGLGKTTLAKFVYNDDRVVNHFERKMWVCVSEEFELQKLVIQILKSSGVNREEYEGKDIDQLQEVLRKTLDGTKYLLILDDVWNENSRKWLELKELLLGCSNGSRIVVTTRSTHVASIMGTMSVYNLEYLPHNNCLYLFSKHAFKEEKDKHNPQLIGIGEEIVRKCKGVPLAIITLATLLNSSTDKREWESIRDNEIWRVEQKENDILPALKLSYKHLPSHLKRCFAYCSIFPKDYEFIDVELVYFWMANGLIQTSRANEELEDVGFRYFKELISRCFFQDFKEFKTCCKCKMHDLIHDLASSVTQNEISVIISSDKEISESVRHLSFPYLKSLPSHLPKSFKSLRHVRNMSFSSPRFEGITNPQFIKACLLRCYYLRVLDFRFSEFETLPGNIGNLKHLRYLSLVGNDYIKRVPNSICKLQHLQFLNLVMCDGLEGLPRDMKDLISLRCLLITTKLKHLPKGGIGSLKSLRILYLSYCDNLKHLFEDIEGLQRLRRLYIIRCHNLISLPKSFQCLTSLDTLVIMYCPSLDLKMKEVDNNQQSTQFSLPILTICGLPELQEFPEWLLRESTNTLETLVIDNCENLRQVPEWVKNIPTLQKLVIKGCPLLQNPDQIEETQ